jgi:hypothetical protein
MSNDPRFLPPMAQPLAYPLPAMARPGILTAVGVISILLGLFGMLSSLATLSQAVMFGILMRGTSTTVWSSPPPPAPAAPNAPAAPATAPATAPASTAPAPMTGSGSVVMGPTMFVSGSPGAFTIQLGPTETALALADGIVGAALAIFLAILGILTLTGSPRARRGHLTWVWLKCPAVVLTAAATASMTKAVFQSVTISPGSTGGIPMGSSIALAQGIVYGVFALIYPMALLIVMRTKTVKEYYEAGAGKAVG